MHNYHDTALTFPAGIDWFEEGTVVKILEISSSLLRTMDGVCGTVCHDILHFSVRVLGTLGLQWPLQQYPRDENATLAWLPFFPPSDHTFYSAVHDRR